jgi:epoxyqueuosine reductase
MVKLKQAVQNHLSDAGFKSEIVSIGHLEQLRSELEILISRNVLKKTFYDKQLSDFRFQIPRELPTAKSIIITATHQPKVIVKFKLNGKDFQVIIPPTYLYRTDGKTFEIISNFLSEYEYSACEAVLPVKALAVHSGLAFYGKNNITYIKNWGSFFRLKAFFSDMPCPSDNWREFTLAEACKKCLACANQCPTQAICQERFLIEHERCLTYLNESVDDFPEWVDPQWHHCLIGCMACQEICPLNKDVKNMSRYDCEFNEDETCMILNGVAKNKLPDETLLKLKNLDIFDDYIAIQRNLKVLIYKKQDKSPTQKQPAVN